MEVEASSASRCAVIDDWLIIVLLYHCHLESVSPQLMIVSIRVCSVHEDDVLVTAPLRTGDGGRDACLGTSCTLYVAVSIVTVRGNRDGRTRRVVTDSCPPPGVNLHALL